MAKRTVNKTQTVLDYLKTHPAAQNREVAAALTKRGIKITANYVATIKSKNGNGKKPAKKAAKKQAPAEVAAPAVVEKPTKAADTVTIEQIRAVTQTVQVIGGFARLNELLGLVKEVGGVKKFKDLLDAMTVSEGN